MKNFLLLAALLSFGAISNAAQITCVGGMAGYEIQVKTVLTHSTAGAIKVVVSQDGNVVTRLTLTPTASDVQPGSHIKISGQSSQGQGSIDATYNASSHNYTGNLDAQTPMGGATVAVTCTLN